MNAHGLPPGLPKNTADAIKLADLNSPTALPALPRERGGAGDRGGEGRLAAERQPERQQGRDQGQTSRP